MHLPRAAVVTAVAIAALLAWSGPAAAEKVVAKGKLKLHASPGESSRVVARVKSGTAMQVLTRKGRWIYVRNGSQRGWVTRTTVREANPVANAERDKRWRRKAADWGKDERATDARDERDDRFRSPFADEPAARVATRDDDADIRETRMRDDGVTATLTAPPPPARTGARAGAELGFRTMSMDYVSDGQSGLADYLISTGAATAAVSADGRVGLGRVRLGAALDYRASYAAPGIHYAPSDGSGEGDVGFTVHELAIAATAGARVTSAAGGVDVHARVGYRYGAFLVDQLANVARMPNESWGGLIAGAVVELPRLSHTVGMAVSYERLVGGSRTQTDGLSDGTMSDLSASWAGVRVDKQLRGNLHLMLGYAYQQSETHWSGPSSRQTGATWATRVDRDHGFSAGVSQRF